MNIDNIMKLADDYGHWREQKTEGHRVTIEARNALRAAIEQALTPGEPDVAGAIENGRIYADKLEADYNFECEAGPLRMCSDWVEFRRCFEWLCENITAPQPQPKQEQKLPEFFTEVEWVGNQMRVHVFQRRADQTPLNVCSQTHNVAPQHPGYAGVTVWLGDTTVTHVVSEEQIKYELWQGHALMYTAQMCLDLLAIHKVS